METSRVDHLTIHRMTGDEELPSSVLAKPDGDFVLILEGTSSNMAKTDITDEEVIAAFLRARRFRGDHTNILPDAVKTIWVFPFFNKINGT